MRTQLWNSRLLLLALAMVALVAIAAVACDGDGSSSPPSSSPIASPGATPVITPGSGVSPVQAVGTYVFTNGLDGYRLDPDPAAQAQCPVEPASQTPVAEGTVTIVSRVFLGQFCLTVNDLVPEKSATVAIDLPGTDEVWEMKLEFDKDVSLWKVKDVDKTGG